MRQLTSIELRVGRILSANRHLLTRFDNFKNTREYIELIDNGYWQGFLKRAQKVEKANKMYAPVIKALLD